MLRSIALFLLLAVTVHGADNYLDITWGTSRAEISCKYELQPFENDLLKESNRLYLVWDFAKDLSLYIAIDGDDLAKMDVKGSEFVMLAFGFHKDRLIYTIMATDETEFNDENRSKYDFLVDELKPDSCQLIWQPVFKSGHPGGTIFNEGAMAVTCGNDRTYYEYQENTGTLISPSHLQFTIFHLDRSFFDELTNSPSYRMEDNLKDVFPSHRTFTRFITEKQRESRQKSLKEKK